MADIVNGRCHAERAPLREPSLVQNGKIVLQPHHIGWIISSVFTVVAIAVSFWLIGKHIRNYTNKYEQRYIVRILFMVPLYAVVSTASYFWWNHSTPLLLIRDCYESTVLTAFFYLLLLYISPDVNVQKEVFRKNGLSRPNDKERRRRGEPLQKWVMPLGFLRWKPEDGLYFLQLMKWGVLQYCVVRPGTTLVAVILDYVGLYCEDSWSLGWGHIWITIVVSLSVTIAMYCLLQLYMVVKVELAPQKPLLKLFAIKAVVFLTFWQSTALSVLTLFGLVKDTPYMTADNINIGLGALLETFEMALFALLHIKAFSYKPYVTGDTTPRLRSLAHAMSFKETGREIWAGWIYMIHRTRGYEVDTQARREAVLEDVFGRSRYAIHREANGSSAPEKDARVTVQVEKEVRVGEERQWLGVGDDYVYGLGYQAKRRKERSEGLETQIEKELTRRGYTLQESGGPVYSPIIDAEAVPVQGHQRDQGSWWRRIYGRISQTGLEPDNGRHPWRRESRVGAVPLMDEVQEDDYNDPPPPSAIRTYRESRNKKQPHKRKAPPVMDLPLLSASFAHISSPPGSPQRRDDAHMAVSQVPPSSTQQGPLAPLVLPPSVQSLQADSFLERAFSGSVEQSSHSATTPSSQSHQTRVVLSPVPTVITQLKVLPQTPVIIDPNTPGPSNPPSQMQPSSFNRVTGSNPASPRSPPPIASPERDAPMMWAETEVRGRRRTSHSHRRDSAQYQYFPEPQAISPVQSPPPPFSPLQSSSTPSPRLHRTSAAYSRGVRRYSGPQPMPMNRFTPSRDRIVLPTPLAATGQVSSPPPHVPPGLPNIPVGRRPTAPHSPPFSTNAR